MAIGICSKTAFVNNLAILCVLCWYRSAACCMTSSGMSIWTICNSRHCQMYHCMHCREHGDLVVDSNIVATGALELSRTAVDNYCIISHGSKVQKKLHYTSWPCAFQARKGRIYKECCSVGKCYRSIRCASQASSAPTRVSSVEHVVSHWQCRRD